MFRRYTPDDFDKHGYLKAPLGFYALLLILLRPYIIWIMSVANRSNGTLLIEFLYPIKSDFLIGLATGSGALLVAMMYFLRRDKAFRWLPKLWKHSRWLLWASLIADILLTVWVVKSGHFSFKAQYAGVFLALLLCGLWIFKNARLKDLFDNWPEEALKGYEKPEEEDKRQKTKDSPRRHGGTEEKPKAKE